MTTQSDGDLVYDAMEILPAFEAYFDAILHQLNHTKNDLNRAIDRITNEVDGLPAESILLFGQVHKDLATLRRNVHCVWKETRLRLRDAKILEDGMDQAGV